jgi:ABC-type Mn2+/Zn2+ transport system ATPase subunit
LEDINLTIPEGSLVAIIGAVGAGKSSLLSAVLGEMKLKKGNVRVKGSIAYTAQQVKPLNVITDNVIIICFM